MSQKQLDPTVKAILEKPLHTVSAVSASRDFRPCDQCKTVTNFTWHRIPMCLSCISDMEEQRGKGRGK